MNIAAYGQSCGCLREHWCGLLLAAATVLAVSPSTQAGGRKEDPRVIPPHANYRGLTYGEWGAEWWKALFAIPVVDGSHPYLDGGAFAGVKGVLCIMGPIGAATMDVTIPAGTPLLAAVINAECSVLEPDRRC